MGFAKKVLRTELIQGLIRCTITAYLRLSQITIKWRVESREIPSEMLENKKPFIIAFWHGRLGMFVHAWHLNMILDYFFILQDQNKKVIKDHI